MRLHLAKRQSPESAHPERRRTLVDRRQAPIAALKDWNRQPVPHYEAAPSMAVEKPASVRCVSSAPSSGAW